MSLPRKLHTAVNSDGVLGQVYHIPMKYAKNFRLFTSGGVHQYSNTDAELKEQMQAHGYSTDDFNHFEPAERTDQLAQQIEEGIKGVNALIASAEEGGDKL